MDQDRIDGVGHQIKGAVKAGLGRIIGDAKLETDGEAEQAAGKARADDGKDRAGRAGIDRDRIAGIGHQFRGAVKQGFGRIVGDAAIEADGAAERAAGKAQNARGSVRDIARDRREGEAADDAFAEADEPPRDAPKQP